jgi:hypothetical protein
MLDQLSGVKVSQISCVDPLAVSKDGYAVAYRAKLIEAVGDVNHAGPPLTQFTDNPKDFAGFRL